MNFLQFNDDGYLEDWTLVSAIRQLELLAENLAAKEREAVASAAAGMQDCRLRDAFKQLANDQGA